MTVAGGGGILAVDTTVTVAGVGGGLGSGSGSATNQEDGVAGGFFWLGATGAGQGAMHEEEPFYRPVQR